jgi:hypothetical protein
LPSWPRWAAAILDAAGNPTPEALVVSDGSSKRRPVITVTLRVAHSLRRPADDDRHTQTTGTRTCSTSPPRAWLSMVYTRLFAGS